MGYTTSGIRNIALVGQAGAGKTSLLETLLLQADAIRTRGSLQRGTTVSDSDPQEKRLQHSLDTAICSFDYRGVHLNVIDTPGYADFLGKALSVLEAVEAVAIVVSAVNGVDSLTQRLMEFARERELCRLVIINKIDSRDAHCAEVLGQLREAFGSECLPLNLPAGGGDGGGGLLLPTSRPRDGLLLGRGRAHADHRPGGRGRRAAHGAVSGAGRGAFAGATARPF